MSDVQIFEPEGRRIPYAEEGAGPAVILLPGQGLTVGYLGNLAHSVSEEDFRVVRIGSRRPTDGAETLEDLAQDVIDVMDALGVDHAWVGGHGFGGSVARAVAAGHHDRVNGVLLMGVESDGHTTSSRDFPGIPERLHDDEVSDMQAAARNAAGQAVPLAEGIPVLVIQGTDDEITPPSNGEALQQSAADRVSVVPIDGAGHMFPFTHMTATSWAIEDYLDWD
ncbi:alpha/beta fold hydrolase [Microbacterium sp. C7(2022)]|uniref:alpha/beta fold hydrolase n=1 Tax=Microbacterium sp. C7(2022) TaxID=2992759 RepID=UPI00237A8E87|nr:alpha/beta fold hydrolase [Microbacterium sp. C7(2022)]MDE0545749.1 alpha/beta fold hydrolase [Microbacterium sp. C7(2022)]